MSAPAQNVAPAQARTIAWTLSSAAAASSAVSSPARTSRDSAFTGGWSIVITATVPSRASVTTEESAAKVNAIRRVSAESHVLEFDRLAVDTHRGWRDPAGELARLANPPHQRGNVRAVVRGRQPLALVPTPFRRVDDAAVEPDVCAGERTDAAVERLVRQHDLRIDPVLLQYAVPAPDA